jgi:hypothetical protein
MKFIHVKAMVAKQVSFVFNVYHRVWVVCIHSYCFIAVADDNVFCADEVVEQESETMDADEEAEQNEELPVLTPAEAYIKRQSDIAEAKKNIASICTHLLSAPEDNVCKFHILLLTPYVFMYMFLTYYFITCHVSIWMLAAFSFFTWLSFV